MLQTYLSIMLGGALGTGLRLFLSIWVDTRLGTNFPWGTILVNIIGCFAIGLFHGATGPDGIFLASPFTRQVVMIGLLGGFTTFSAFSLQTVALFSAGEFLYAGANIFVSVLLCFVGTWGGFFIARGLEG